MHPKLFGLNGQSNFLQTVFSNTLSVSFTGVMSVNQSIIIIIAALNLTKFSQ